MNWGAQQSKALDDVATWLKSDQQVFTLFGYAGTGKTTLAKHLAATASGLVLFSAYTGKAASVLRTKGCENAATLHSLLYEVSPHDKGYLEQLIEELATLTNPLDRRIAEADIREERARVARPRFSVNPESVIKNASLIVLDECSMVNASLAHDLLQFRKKVLVLGDPAQLPPVKGGGYFTNKTPDVLLTEIHRQALDNPILRWATAVRSGKSLPYADEGAAKKVSRDDMGMKEISTNGSQMLTGKNETRRKLNQAARRTLGHHGRYPNANEQLVILRNDREMGVLNGVVCTTTMDASDPEEGSFSIAVNYEGRDLALEMDCQHFDAYADPQIAELPDSSRDRGVIPADFGYALTVHKAQGSQWEKVTVCDDGFAKWDPRMRQRWLYTAITRAAETLLIVG